MIKNVSKKFCESGNPKNPDSDIPPNWSWVKLGDVVERMSNGCSAAQHQDKGDYPITRIETISFSEVDLNRVRYVKDISIEDVEKYQLSYNDILFSHINSDIHLGKTALFKLKDKVVIHGINLLLIRANEKIHSNFLNYLFNFYRTKGEFLKIAQHAVNQSSINQKKLKNVEIPLPPIPEQKKIVEKIEELFSGLDSGVASLKKAKEQIKLYRQSVLAAAFSGKLTGQRAECKAQSEMLQAAEPKVDYGKNGLPEGWKWVKLGEVTKINPKLPINEIQENILVSFLPMRQVEELTGNFDLSLERKYSEVKKGFTPFTNGDVIFAKITPCMENGKIAVMNKLKNKIGFGSTEFHVLRVNNELLNHYLFYFLIQDSFRAEAQHNMTGAVGQKRVPKRFLEEYKILLPPLNQQTKIVEEIEKRFSEADNLEKVIDESLTKSETLRQSILKKAFEGKLV